MPWFLPAMSVAIDVVRGLLCRVLLCFLLAGAFVPPAGAAAGQSSVPPGWTIDGDELVWSSPSPLRMGGARYEFRAGGELLGYPVQRGNELRMRTPPRGPLQDLSVWAAGRRIDAPVSLARIAPATLPTESSTPLVAVADAAAGGPYAIERLRYSRAGLPVVGYPAPVEVVAEVTAPTESTDTLPLVLFLHGRHSTCYRGGPDGEPSGDWPCPEGWKPVPSHTGYRYIADVLASQGHLVVSIAANGINAQDAFDADGGAHARSKLVQHHLTLWARWNESGGDPWGGRFRGRVDLGNTVLVGHSRGGEGVERAAIDTDEDDPWRLRGLVLIGPTAFGRQVAPGIHTTVILPFCDGDVSDLQGQQYVDIGRDLTSDRALRSSVMAMGTNHNYYNTEWTPGLSRSPAWDDWFDSNDAQCGENRSRRLTPEEQQRVGLAYTAALVDLAVRGDTRSMRLLDGTPVKPESIGRAVTHVHAIGGNKRVLYVPGTGKDVTAKSLNVRECRGYYSAGPFDLRTGCTPRLFFEVLPHWSPMAFAETAPPPRALEVKWQRAGGYVRIPLSRSPIRADALDFRIAGEPGAAPVELSIRVRDRSGRWVAVDARSDSVRSYAGPNPLGKVAARQLRASLRHSGLDARDVTEVELVPRTASGKFWLLDVSARNGYLPDTAPIHLPRVSVGDVVVPEGDSGRITVDVPVTIEGTVTRRASLWVQVTDYADMEQPTKGFPLVLEPGATSATIPVTYVADDVFNPYSQLRQITLLARRHAVTGDFDGTLLVEEDEPAPQLTVDAAHVTAEEGAFLEWTFRLSEPMSGGGFWVLQMLPTEGRFAELDSDDVPPSYLEERGIVPPVPAVPLSALGLFLYIEFAPGASVATLSLPIADDGAAEGSEGVVLLLDGFGDPVVPQPIEITGLVPANP